MKKKIRPASVLGEDLEAVIKRKIKRIKKDPLPVLGEDLAAVIIGSMVAVGGGQRLV